MDPGRIRHTKTTAILSRHFISAPPIVSAISIIPFETSVISPATPSVISSATPPTAPLPSYRALSPPPPTYAHSCLTVHDLFMRYILVSKLSKPDKFSKLRVLSTMSIQDLYKRFDKQKGPWKKPVLPYTKPQSRISSLQIHSHSAVKKRIPQSLSLARCSPQPYRIRTG